MANLKMPSYSKEENIFVMWPLKVHPCLKLYFALSFYYYKVVYYDINHRNALKKTFKALKLLIITNFLVY